MRYISIFNQLDQRLRYLHGNHKIPSSQPQDTFKPTTMGLVDKIR
jgi:hypothetical protein